MSVESIAGLADSGADRRRFIGRAAGIAALGVLGTSPLTVSTVSAQAIVTDTDVLNFALNLEYLEAEFYLRGVFNRGLNPQDITGNGTLGGVSGGSPVPFQTNAVRQYFEEVARDEEAHVRFLRSALGEARVARPAINLSTSFTAAACAAGLIGPSETFDPFANENNFLLGSFIFEDVGVTAYAGGSRFITNRDIRQAAAGILAAESFHASLVRTLLFERGFAEATRRISDARDALDGAEDKDQGVVESGTITSTQGVNIVPTDANALAFSRTFAQVLAIVYLGAQPSDISFLPQGANGNIR